MKKHVFFALVAFVLVGLTSCDKSEPCCYHSRTLDLTVLDKDWKWDKDKEIFFYGFDVPDLTASVYDYGTITVAREYNFGTNDAYQVALPESSYILDQVINGNDTTYTPYVQHIDYAFGIGWVEVSLRNSDYIYPTNYQPETMHFRLQLVY